MIKPLLVFMNTMEKVNVSVRKTKKKNKGRIPRSLGFVRNISATISTQRSIVIKTVNEKFLRSLISFFLLSFFTILTYYIIRMIE